MESNDLGDTVQKLAALAQETRLALFRLLVEAGHGGLSAGVIAERLGVPAPTLSFHLKELNHAGLIRATQNGRYVVYRADFEAMNALIAYLTENCCATEREVRCMPGCAPPAARPPARKRVTATTTRRRSS